MRFKSENLDWTWASLNPAVKRKIKSLEQELEKKAYVVSDATNPLGERYLYVRLGKKKDPENIIATVAVFDTAVIGNWNTFC